MESSTQKSSRKKGATGILIGAGALLAVVGGIILMNSGGSGTTPPLVITPPVNNGGSGGLIPEGPITDAEKAACEQVLAMKPQPASYKDDDGRVWTPCVEWWLGTDIPNWPSGMWPGQLQYLHKPADTAEWLACIAGYLVYKDPLTKAAKETFTDEAATVEITRLLSGRRSVMRSYMAMRMGQLKRVNAVNNCFKPGDVVPKPDNNPPPPSPDDLTFDLEGNWGGIPMDLRVWLAKAELASGIPGLARAAGVRWWESFRAKKEPVSTAEAAAIAAANPELARFFVNKNDGAQAKKAIDEDMAKQGWPKPVDYEGWIAGSFGLGDILGSTFVYTGIHTEGKKAGPSGLPFVYASSAKKQYESYEGQIAALAYIVYRILYGPYDVLRPGVQAKPEVQDSEQTWINIFAAYAYPDSYKAKTQLAANAAANYTKRAAEIGINLSKVAYPWPPGLSYKPWDFSDFWARLQAYAPQKVKHLPGIYEANVQMPQNPGIFAQPANKVALQGNVQASIASVIPAGASAPLVIFLHDQDADESQLAGLVPADMVNARLAFLRAPIKSTLGYRWFEGDLGQINAPSLAAQIDAAANVVSAAGQQLVKLYPGTSEVYVVGFGQGGAIAYRLAARGEVAKVLAIAGGLPPALRLADGKTTKTNVWAVHGSNDQVVPLPIDQQTIESFIFKTPSEAKLAIVNGGVHTLQSLQDQVGAALVEML